MTKLCEALINAAANVLSEDLDSSKEMIQQNVVPSFDNMGMANTAPGEFSPEEITDKQNLVNTAEMSNDTDFEGKVSNEENVVNDVVNAAEDMMNDLVDISVEKPIGCEGPDCEDKEKELHILEFGESYISKIIDKTLGGKTCEQYLTSLFESNYDAPLDFVPDLRFNTADVVAALKHEIGKGSEGIHVDSVIDNNRNKAFKVSQIDKDLLPKKFQVENVILKLDGDTYYVDKPSDKFPLAK